MNHLKYNFVDADNPQFPMTLASGRKYEVVKTTVELSHPGPYTQDDVYMFTHHVRFMG